MRDKVLVFTEMLPYIKRLKLLWSISRLPQSITSLSTKPNF